MKNEITFILKRMIFISCFAFPIVSLAQDGSLDLSFDTDGVTSTAIGANALANSVAIQSDGKIVVAGTSNDATGIFFTLARYNTNGSLDNTFDTDGIVTTAIGTTQDKASSVAIQANGKIVVAGASEVGSGFVFALARYNIDGSLDSTFDNDGIVTTAVGTTIYESISDPFLSMVIQADGKIIIAGSSKNSNSIFCYTLVRYNVDGSLDNTFGINGIVITSTPNSAADIGRCLAIQSDGKIIVAGHSPNSMSLVRYNTNGSLDNSFDNDGIVVTTNFNCWIYSIAIQCNGKIVVAGGLDNYYFALARYNINGSLDNTFDTDGMVTSTIGTSGSHAFSVAIQEDQKIVAMGESGPFNYLFTAVRYNTNGSLDNSFDMDGIVTTNPGGFAYSGAIQADGKIVLVGFMTNASNQADFAVVRYNNSSITGAVLQCPTICNGQSITVGSNSYTISGTYIDTLTSVSATDSIIITNLTVDPLPVITTSLNGVMISSNQSGAIYQWIDCNNANSPIVGETNQSFTATANGSYAVIVNLSSCPDTSACITISNVGISAPLTAVGQISIYPNPFSRQTTFQTKDIWNHASLSVYNSLGKKVKEIKDINGQTYLFYKDNLPNGFYFIYLTQDDGSIITNKLVISD